MPSIMDKFTTFTVLKESEIILLNKGMSKEEVVAVLGTKFRIEKCSNPNNEKRIYALFNNEALFNYYCLLFSNGSLEWAIKIN